MVVQLIDTEKPVAQSHHQICQEGITPSAWPVYRILPAYPRQYLCAVSFGYADYYRTFQVMKHLENITWATTVEYCCQTDKYLLVNIEYYPEGLELLALKI